MTFIKNMTTVAMEINTKGDEMTIYVNKYWLFNKSRHAGK